MTIQYVGGVTASRAGNTGTTVQSLTSLTGGIGTAPIAGDLIVVTCVVGSAGRNPAQGIGGYTTIGTQLNPNATTQDTSLQVSYKFAGSSPDTSVTIPATGNVADAQSWAIQVFRGVSQSTPLDVAAVSATGTGTSRADPAAITPTTSGAWILVCAGGGAAATSNYSFAGLTNVLSSSGSDSNDSVVGMGYKSDWSSGAYNEGASSTGSANAADSWASWTIALRPVPALATFTENFGAALDTTNKWSVGDNAAWISVTGGMLSLDPDDTAGTTFAWIEGKVNHCLDDSEFVIQLINPLRTGAAENGYLFIRVRNNPDDGSFPEWMITGDGILFARYNVSWAPDANTVNVGTWSSTNHKWLKFAKASNGTITWSTAPDSGSGTPGTWTVQRTLNSIPGFTNTVPVVLTQWVGPTTITQVAQLDGINTTGTAGAQNTTSQADPASYSMTGVAATSGRQYFSSANPVVYATSPAAGSEGIGSLALPLAYSFTVPATTDALASVGSPAAYSMAGASITDGFNQFSIALPATYLLSPVAALGVAGPAPAFPATYSMVVFSATGRTDRVSKANQATYLLTGVSTTSGQSITGTADPTTYSWVGAAATSTATQGISSVALPASYSMSPASTSVLRARISLAIPAEYFLLGGTTSDSTTGTEEGSVIPTTVDTHRQPPLTDAQFITWLKETEDAFRVVLVECQCIDDNGNTKLLFFANRAYVSGPFDSIANQVYEPWLRGGLDFKSQLSLDLSASSQSYGDIELDNTEGDLDWVLERSWQYQPVRAFIGDARWPRQDFRQIFDGICEDVDSSDRHLINLRLRDKLYRLDMPIHDNKVGGTSASKDALLPAAFGECHNVTPVLTDANTLTYCFHTRMAESVFEVRDNGVPVGRVFDQNSSPATFSLANQPAGRITCSIQGDRTAFLGVDPTEGYQRTVVGVVYRLLTQWGTEPDKRFTDADFDLDSLYQFTQNNPQPVGVYFTERVTVLSAAQQVAASIGARMVMDSNGKMRLVQVDVPPQGTPIEVGTSDMVAGSLQVSGRPTLIPSVKLGYAKNWTVQPDTAAGLPEEHKKLFAEEWLTVTGVNEDVKTKFHLWGEPEQENTFLLTRDDAAREMFRRRHLRTTQRHVYQFTGFADLVFTPIGAPVHLTHDRFGLSGPGKIGQVVSVAVDWLHARTTLEVLA